MERGEEVGFESCNLRGFETRRQLQWSSFSRAAVVPRTQQSLNHQDVRRESQLADRRGFRRTVRLSVECRVPSEIFGGSRYRNMELLPEGFFEGG